LKEVWAGERCFIHDKTNFFNKNSAIFLNFLMHK
jgi:hypothetical protein